jgi:hypothetical protein
MKKQTAIISLAAAVVIAGALGFWIGSAHTKNKTTAKRAAFMQGGNGGFNRDGFAGQGMRGGGFITGTVIDANDSSITVKSMDGSSKIILLGDTTMIAKSTAGAKTDLTAGTGVVINGTQNSDGSITATNIQIRPESMPARR